ncbi:MAG: carbon storage regulator, partial [Planctomycetota bacterium]
MLNFSRKDNERFVIRVGQTDIVVRVRSAGRKRTRVGIEAPRDVIIIREELLPDDAPSRNEGVRPDVPGPV